MELPQFFSALDSWLGRWMHVGFCGMAGQGGLQQLPPAPVKLQQHTERGRADLLESPEEERC